MSSGSGGLGWFIFENKNQLEIPNVFAGLFTVIVIGLIVENVVFRTIEARTVRRWGMQAWSRPAGGSAGASIPRTARPDPAARILSRLMRVVPDRTATRDSGQRTRLTPVTCLRSCI